MTTEHHGTLEERIEAEFDRAIAAKSDMQTNASKIADSEETAKMDNLDEWTGAKNNDVRHSIVLRALAEDEDYHTARQGYRAARDRYRLAVLEIERLKLLVAARAAAPAVPEMVS